MHISPDICIIEVCHVILSKIMDTLRNGFE
jgi:hypothetical protein